MGPSSNDQGPYWGQRGGEGHKTKAETRMVQPQAEELGSHSKVKEARKDPPPEPSEAARSCQHLDFELLASTAVREYFSVVLNHPDNDPLP